MHIEAVAHFFQLCWREKDRIDNTQIPGMPKMIDNINLRVCDDLGDMIAKKSKLRIAVDCFSTCAYEELKRY